MKPRAVVLVLLCAALASSQPTRVLARQAGGQAAVTPPVPVIQIGLDLVRIDAAVVDRAGRPVVDLRPEDFTLEVDGRKQPVTNAAYFGAKPVSANSGSVVMTTAASESASVPDMVVFIVDDLNISFSSMYAARQALSKFATELSPSGATFALRLTSDETNSFKVFRSADRLLAAANDLRYNMRSTQGVSSVPDAIRMPQTTNGRAGTQMTSEAAAMMSGANPTMALENLRQCVFNLVSTVDTLRSMPGRKAVVFLSEGFSVGGPREDLGFDSPFFSLFDDTDIQAALRMITDVANRASVVLYAVDPRGLMIDGPTAADNVAPEQVSSLMAGRRQSRVASQQSLQQLAEDTGGIAVVNTNGLREGLAEVMRDHGAYYLLGFEPPANVFEKSSKGRPRFHTIKLKVNRPGLHVRTRSGFYGVTDQEVVARAPLTIAPEY